MKAIIFIEKKTSEMDDPSEVEHTIERRVIWELESNVEEVTAVLRANFDLNTMKLYVDIDEESEDQPTKADFVHAVQQWWCFIF